MGLVTDLVTWKIVSLPHSARSWLVPSRPLRRKARALAKGIAHRVEIPHEKTLKDGLYSGVGLSEIGGWTLYQY